MKFQSSPRLHPSQGGKKQVDLLVRKVKIQSKYSRGWESSKLLGLADNPLYDETLREKDQRAPALP